MQCSSCGGFCEDFCKKVNSQKFDKLICTKAPVISPVSAAHLNALYVLDSEISDAIAKARDASIPIGLLVSVLHEHSTSETLKMLHFE